MAETASNQEWNMVNVDGSGEVVVQPVPKSPAAKVNDSEKRGLVEVMSSAKRQKTNARIRELNKALFDDETPSGGDNHSASTVQKAPRIVTRSHTKKVNMPIQQPK